MAAIYSASSISSRLRLGNSAIHQLFNSPKREFSRISHLSTNSGLINIENGNNRLQAFRSYSFGRFSQHNVSAPLLTRNALQMRYLDPTYTQVAHIAHTPLDQHPPIPKDLPMTDPDKGSLVYIGEHAQSVKRVKLFTMATSVISISLMPALFEQLQGFGIAWFIGTFGVTGLFAFVTPVVFHNILKRYVLHMYYNDATEQYHASTITFLCKPYDQVFKADDVKVVHTANVFESANVKGQPFIVDHLGFLRKDAMMKFFKYDKPFSLIEEMREMQKDQKDKET